jgi:hypothetical protein
MRHRRTVTHVLAALLAGWSAWAGAQSTASHGVSVSIPDFIGIRIVGTGSGARAVVFDYDGDPVAYLQSVNGSGILPPTQVNRFDDVEVNSTRNGRWQVDVIATPLSFVGAGTAGGLALSDIVVVRGSRSGLTQAAIVGPGGSTSYDTSWPLSTITRRIATRTGSTQGWRSLGFNGLDYSLLVQGDEAHGTYTTIVTYLLSSP